MTCTICGKSMIKAFYLDNRGVRICGNDCLDTYADQREAKRAKAAKSERIEVGK